MYYDSSAFQNEYEYSGFFFSFFVVAKWLKIKKFFFCVGWFNNVCGGFSLGRGVRWWVLLSLRGCSSFFVSRNHNGLESVVLNGIKEKTNGKNKTFYASMRIWKFRVSIWVFKKVWLFCFCFSEVSKAKNDFFKKRNNGHDALLG